MYSPVKTNNLKVTSYYGNRTYTYQGKKVSDFHTGIDLVGGTDIVAFEDGVVTGLCNKGEQYGTACYVRIKHSNGMYTLYYHLKSGSICVTKGQTVKKGDKIGIMGATGVATGVHLHFQIDKGGSSSSVNPYDYIFNDKELVPTPSPTEDFKVGDIVIPIKLENWKGTKLKQYDKSYKIISIDKRGAVLGALRKGKYEIWAVLPLSNIKKV